MVRSKYGSARTQSEDNEKLLYQLNHKILELRRRHIEASRQHQIEMEDISKKIDALCSICDQMSTERISKKSKENDPPQNSMESSLNQSTVPKVLEFNATNEKSSTEVTIRKSALKISESNVNETISPSSTRVLRNRTEVSRKMQQTSYVSETIREIDSGTRTVRRVSFAKSAKYGEIKEMLRTFNCKPCTIPLRDCEQRLRKRKRSSL